MGVLSMRPVDWDPSASERAEHWRVLKELARYLWPDDRRDLRWRVVVAMIFLVAAKAVNVVVPYLLKLAVDSLAPAASGQSVPLSITMGFVIAYAVARVLNQTFGELRDFVFAKVSQHTQRTVGLTTFKHLHSLSLSFHLDRQTGGLSRAIERGTRGIQTVLSFMLFNILPTLLEVFLVAGILWITFGWPIAVVTFVTIIGYIAYTLTVTDWRTKFRRTMNQKDSEANTKAIDSLLNYETVKYFSNEEHEYSRFDSALEGYESAAVKSQTTLSLLNIGQGLIISAGLVAILIMSARGVAEGTMTVGDFVLVNTYLIQLYLPLNFLGFVYREIKQSLVDMDKMFELLHVPRAIEDKHLAPELQVTAGEVVFDRVDFGYLPERTVLRNVSFRVPPGKTVAIVGPSGSGKSTISRLLFRFYDVGQGSIRIDGQDLRDVTQSSVRRAIGIVPQDTVLFNDSIAYNIRYGNPLAREEEIRHAARLAQMESFIEKLPKRYETRVGERGLKLSGGEKQRVAIARTILKNPKILVFDEATSALDSQTERGIQDSLRQVSKDRSTLMIAHRLSTVVHADEILVLKDGAIIERGTHQELLALNGEYAMMWARQAQARAAEEQLKATTED
jgi:ATP-binding cassette, subfamily B, heavy metal transporter